MNKCLCHHLPAKGSFKIGAEYLWIYIIDGIKVTDDNGDFVSFDEYTFLRYFTKVGESIKNPPV